ncbi:MAG: hypothetical protein WAZ27_00200 [Minisyncoccia bacterium]
MRFDTSIQVRIKDAYASRHEPEAARIVARMYWALIVMICALAASLAVAYGVWEFFRGPTAETSSVTVRPQTLFTKTQLDVTLKGFDDRAARFQTRLTAPVPVKDPS